MILRSSRSSPFSRKVKIVAMHCGLASQLKIENTNTDEPEDSIRKQNPLGKIPTLILEDGVCLYDSHVICEYLDSLHHRIKLFPSGTERWGALTLAALGDGIIEASLLQVYERQYRPAVKYHDKWVDHQSKKISRSLAFLEANPPLIGEAPNIGHITMACALSYLEFRFGPVWQADQPKLQNWLKRFSVLVPAFQATSPKS